MTLVYRYGLLPPTLGGEHVAEQLRRAHRYRNTLVEIERRRREAVRAVLGAQADVAALTAQLDALREAQAAHRTRLAATRAETRRRAVSPEDQARAEALRAAIRETRATLRAARQARRHDPTVREALARIEAAAAAERKAARAACGVYWGTYLQVEAAMDAARRSVTDPRFARWTGDGTVAVQIQGGMTVDALLAATDTRLQLDRREQPVPGRAGRPRPRVRLRVGSTADRAPIWAEWPVILHRPLPPAARITWAAVDRRRIAGRDVWSLRLTVEIPDVVAEDAGRVVALDLGWRRLEDGSLRAGGWSDGTTGADIVLDGRYRGAMRKVEDLRSIRDRHRQALQQALLAWRAAQETLAPELAERLAYLPQWRAPARFEALALWWRAHRQPGDEAIVAQLEAWRTRDRHLWRYEAGTRRRALARRREQYRCLAARLAQEYDTLVVERLDLSALARVPGPDEARESHPRGRSQRHETAPSELRAAVVHAFRRRGKRVVTVPPSGPAEALLAAWRAQQGVAELPGAARVSKFGRLRARRQAAGASPEA